jgi:prepilin-type N-terminal cleavage/methylation domain-containing protein
MFARVRETKGFALRELMIVAAIIGILVSVAAPYFQKTALKSRMTGKTSSGISAVKSPRCPTPASSRPVHQEQP